MPSRSQRRHAAAEESFERSLLLLLVLLVLLGGVTIVAEVAVSQKAAAPLLEVPNLNAARSLEEAREMAGEDFVVEGVPVESGEPVDAVVSQDPKPGEMAVQGATISVRVSGRQIDALPDVEGKTVEEARQSIRSRPFSLEIKTVESSSQEVGRVISQDPKGGDGVTAEAGTHVTVTVGEGPSAAKSSAPRESLPKEATPVPGNQTRTLGDQTLAGRNAEQRPATVTAKAEPDASTEDVYEPASDWAPDPDTVGYVDDEEDHTTPGYDSWRGQPDQYVTE